MPVARLQVEGLDQFRRELRRADPDVAKRVGVANRRLARFVIDRANLRKQRLEGRYPSYTKVRLRESDAIRVAQVIVGPKSVGFAGEFGARRHPVFGRMRSQTEFRRRVWPDWSGNRFTLAPGETSGYLVHPTIRDHQAQLEQMYLDELADALTGPFPE